MLLHAIITLVSNLNMTLPYLKDAGQRGEAGRVCTALWTTGKVRHCNTYTQFAWPRKNEQFYFVSKVGSCEVKLSWTLWLGG